MTYYVPIMSRITRGVKRKLRSSLYKGSEVFCPVCQGGFKAFFGGPVGSCPGCASPARARLLWHYFETSFRSVLQDPIALLQFAPAWGLENALRRQPKLRYLSADLYEPDAMIRLDITDIALPDESIDVVICSHVLEHVPNDRKAMREMYRILRPGGTAFIQVPQTHEREHTIEDPTVIDADARNREYGQFDHVRNYGRDFLPRLQGAAFEVSVVRPTEALDEATQRRLGLWNDAIYVCHRPG